MVETALPLSTSTSSCLSPLAQFETVLAHQGAHAALGYLNSRTPHRYTGLFLYRGPTLDCLVLFDRFDPQGEEQRREKERKVDQQAEEEGIPLANTYCSLLDDRSQGDLEILDAPVDPRLAVCRMSANTPVVSYCGVLILDRQGRRVGTLCHYDMQRCQERSSDLPLMHAAARSFYDHVVCSVTSAGTQKTASPAALVTLVNPSPG
jgi:hypothetical protein